MVRYKPRREGVWDSSEGSLAGEKGQGHLYMEKKSQGIVLAHKHASLAPLAAHNNCTLSPANEKAEYTLIQTLLGGSEQPGSPLHKSCLEPKVTQDMSIKSL